VDEHLAAIAVDGEQIAGAYPAEQPGHVADQRQPRGLRDRDRGGRDDIRGDERRGTARDGDDRDEDADAIGDPARAYSLATVRRPPG
jgi:hypothetical protein